MAMDRTTIKAKMNIQTAQKKNQEYHLIPLKQILNLWLVQCMPHKTGIGLNTG
jgi:hypothetical protein